MDRQMKRKAPGSETKNGKPFVPIRTKIFAGCVTIAILTEMLVFTAVFSTYRQNARKQYYQQTQQAITLLSDSMRKNLAEMEQGIIYKTWGSSIFRSDYDYFQDNLHMYQRNLQKLSSMFLMSHVPLKAIYSCDSMRHEAFYSVSNSDVKNLEDYRKSEIGRYLRNHRKEISGKAGKTWFRSFADQPDSVYMIKNVIDTNTTDYLGTLVLELDRKYLQDMYESVGTAYESEFVIYENGELLSCAESFREEAEKYREVLREGKEELRWGRYLVCTGEEMRNGWTIVVFKPEAELMEGMRDMVPQFILYGLLTLALSMLFSRWLARTQTENIDAMVRQIRKIHGSSPDALTKVEVSSNDEMRYLEDAFNELIDQLNVSVQRLAYASVEKERAEYNALMAQMDPHFLYNTLEGISSLARLHGDHSIVECTNRLSRLYRVAVHGKSSEIPLREEMSYVENYLELEKMITGGRISIIVDPEEETLDLPVPKLIVQPIVENSIRHGVEDMVEGGTVLVTTRIEEGKLKIDVADNGKGIPPEKIPDLLSTEEADAMHIGIGAVQRRIRILYGEEYGLSIRSDQEGTTVTITLPVQERGKSNLILPTSEE